MNRCSKIIAIFCLSTVTLFAQTTEKDLLFSAESQWSTILKVGVAFPYSPTINYKYAQTRTYFLEGDTSLQEITYQKLYSTTKPIVDKKDPENRYEGGLRTAQQQVYFREVGAFNQEKLLYDFDISVGDTLDATATEIDFPVATKIVVESIDTIITADQVARRKYNFIYKSEFQDAFFPLTAWVEGIGNIGAGGLLETHLDGRIYSPPTSIDGGNDVLVDFQCFALDQQIVYQSPKYETCYTNQTGEFAPVKTTWHYGHQATDETGTVNDFFTLTSIKDTLVFSVSPSKVLEINTPTFTNLKKRRFIIRQKGQRIEYVENDRYYLLYDFAATTGDTLNIRFPSNIGTLYGDELTNSFVVNSVSTLMINGEERKVQHISPPLNGGSYQYGPTIVEGIGSLEGWFLPFEDCPTCGDIATLRGLRCYDDDFLGEWQVSEEDCEYQETILSYTPFPTENGIWNTLESRSDNFAPNVFGTTEKTRTHFMFGDTTLNNQAYHKIYTTQNEQIPAIPTVEQYAEAFRESSKIVYFWDKDRTDERILYDFNIAIGDTIATIKDDVSTEFQIFVSNIDTVTTEDNKGRKRYELSIEGSPLPDTTIIRFFSYWIEGIGDVQKGFLSFPDVVSPFEGANQFQCFSREELVVYQNPTIDSCYTDQSEYTVEYSPFVLENATWILVNSYDDFTINEYFAYKIQGDSTIDNTVYKRLFYYELEKNGADKFQILSESIAGYLRENVTDQKVYIRFLENSRGGCSGLNEDQLFLDYNKKVGAEFADCHTQNKEIQESLTITQDPILELFGQYRRVLSNGGIELIEGIGYGEGLFAEPTSLITQAFGSSIFNYCIGNKFNCNLLTHTNVPLPQKVAIFPNPANDYLNLQFEQIFDGQIQLHSLAGQVVYQSVFQATTHEIHIADLPKGVYLLHLQSTKGYYIQKVFIQ